MSLMQWLESKFCGRNVPPTVDRGELPQEVRRVSHEIANKAAAIHSAANQIRRDVDVMIALTKGMQHGNKH